MVLDLGAIGKGYAADEVMKLLKSSGISSALIDMGGDIMVSDPPPDKLYWTLGFSYFKNDGSEILQKIKLENQAIATSGDKYQFVELDGSRYSHIVDPMSGIPLKNRVQVTVIAKNASHADAYASAFSVMGLGGTEVHNRKMSNLKVFMVENKDGKYHQWMSQDFSDIIFDH